MKMDHLEPAEGQQLVTLEESLWLVCDAQREEIARLRRELAASERRFHEVTERNLAAAHERELLLRAKHES